MTSKPNVKTLAVFGAIESRNFKKFLELFEFGSENEKYILRFAVYSVNPEVVEYFIENYRFKDPKRLDDLLDYTLNSQEESPGQDDCPCFNCREDVLTTFEVIQRLPYDSYAEWKLIKSLLEITNSFRPLIGLENSLNYREKVSSTGTKLLASQEPSPLEDEIREFVGLLEEHLLDSEVEKIQAFLEKYPNFDLEKYLVYALRSGNPQAILNLNFFKAPFPKNPFAELFSRNLYPFFESKNLFLESFNVLIGLGFRPDLNDLALCFGLGQVDLYLKVKDEFRDIDPSEPHVGDLTPDDLNSSRFLKKYSRLALTHF